VIVEVQLPERNEFQVRSIVSASHNVVGTLFATDIAVSVEVFTSVFECSCTGVVGHHIARHKVVRNLGHTYPFQTSADLVTVTQLVCRTPNIVFKFGSVTHNIGNTRISHIEAHHIRACPHERAVTVGKPSTVCVTTCVVFNVTLELLFEVNNLVPNGNSSSCALTGYVLFVEKVAGQSNNRVHTHQVKRCGEVVLVTQPTRHIKDVFELAVLVFSNVVVTVHCTINKVVADRLSRRVRCVIHDVCVTTIFQVHLIDTLTEYIVILCVVATFEFALPVYDFHLHTQITCGTKAKDMFTGFEVNDTCYVIHQAVSVGVESLRIHVGVLVRLCVINAECGIVILGGHLGCDVTQGLVLDFIYIFGIKALDELGTRRIGKYLFELSVVVSTEELYLFGTGQNACGRSTTFGSFYLNNDLLYIQKAFTKLNDLRLRSHTQVKRAKSLLAFSLGIVVGDIDFAPLTILVGRIVNHTLDTRKVIECEGDSSRRLHSFARSLPIAIQITIKYILNRIISVRRRGLDTCTSDTYIIACIHTVGLLYLGLFLRSRLCYGNLCFELACCKHDSCSTLLGYGILGCGEFVGAILLGVGKPLSLTLNGNLAQVSDNTNSELLALGLNRNALNRGFDFGLETKLVNHYEFQYVLAADLNLGRTSLIGVLLNCYGSQNRAFGLLRSNGAPIISAGKFNGIKIRGHNLDNLTLSGITLKRQCRCRSRNPCLLISGFVTAISRRTRHDSHCHQRNQCPNSVFHTFTFFYLG